MNFTQMSGGMAGEWQTALLRSGRSDLWAEARYDTSLPLERPACVAQMRAIEGCLRPLMENSPESIEIEWIHEYARTIRSLDSVPILKRMLHAARETGVVGRIIVDDVARLMKVVPLDMRGSFLKEFEDFGDQIIDARLNLRFSGLPAGYFAHLHYSGSLRKSGRRRPGRVLSEAATLYRELGLESARELLRSAESRRRMPLP